MKSFASILRERERSIKQRLTPNDFDGDGPPVFGTGRIHLEISERVRAIDCGGIGVFHALANASGLVKSIDERLHLLKRHLPYHESDHVMNIAFNFLSGGRCLDDLERRRQDEAYLDALDAERIPDPTTSGDFTRRFSAADVETLMDLTNDIRPRFWRIGLSKSERTLAIIDIDGTICPTCGECKGGMDMTYKGTWGYAPLLISLRNTQEPIFIVNRSGNRPSHDGFVPYADRAINVAREAFDKVMLAGDSAFSVTTEFDRWTEDGVLFVFGYNATRNLIDKAEDLPAEAWTRLERRNKKPRKGPKRRRPKRVKQEVVVARGYKDIVLRHEFVAEFEYRPARAKRTYRLIVLRKELEVRKGQKILFDEEKYLFYITNITDVSAAEIVFLANDRCNQENLIEQMKNGVPSLHAPVDNLVSNWAFMVMASLAWTMKAWLALVCKDRRTRDAVLRMEFRTCLNRLVMIPAQILSSGRRLVHRFLAYTPWLKTLRECLERIRRLQIA